MKKIIVFGATGNIGVYLVDYLCDHLDKDFQVFAVGRKETNYFADHGIEYIRVDITQADAFDQLPQDDVFAVVNLAGVLPAYESSFSPKVYLDTNVYGGINILEYARKVHANRILYAQTWAELAGYWGKRVVLSPDLPRKLLYTGDHAFYAITKSMIVDSLEFYWQEYGLRRFVFRLPNVYLYNPEKFYFVDGVKRVISYRYLIDQASEGRDIELWGNPKAFKDILYVKDLCQMMCLSITANVDGGIYNAGTGIRTSFDEQIKGIIDVFSPKDKPSRIIYRPEKPSFTSFVMDIDNARKDLGYCPEYSYRLYLEDYKKEQLLKRFDTIFQKPGK